MNLAHYYAMHPPTSPSRRTTPRIVSPYNRFIFAFGYSEVTDSHYVIINTIEHWETHHCIIDGYRTDEDQYLIDILCEELELDEATDATYDFYISEQEMQEALLNRGFLIDHDMNDWLRGRHSS